MNKKVIVRLCSTLVVLLLVGAVAVETVQKLAVEPRVISDWEDCLSAMLTARSQLPPLPLPASPKELVASMESGDWSFVTEPFWYVGMAPTTLYVSEESELAKQLELPLEVVAIEDLYRGTITVYGKGKDGSWEGLAQFKAPPVLDETDSSYMSLSVQEQELLLSARIGASRFRWSAILKPESEAWSDLVLRTSETESALALLEEGGAGMAMSSPPPEHTNDLWLSLSGTTLKVFAPPGFSNRVEVYQTTDLVSNVWNIAEQNLLPVHTNPVSWDADIGPKGFFVAGNMDIDSDLDELPDAREKFVHKTEPQDADTDGDGYLDGWEVQYGLNPLTVDLPSNEDADGDGFVNLYEYVSESDPVDSNSVPVATRFVSLAGSNAPPFDTWGAAAYTIQSALDAATNDYEIILVADGTYAGVGNTALNFKGKKLMLVSENGASNCAIDGEYSRQGMIFQGDETRETIVRGIQIQNTYDSQNRSGVVCSNSSPTIECCSFVGNYGAVYGENSSVLLRNCRFVGNEAYFNANVGSAGFFDGGSPEISNCEILDNWDFAGGTLYFTNVEMVVLSGCVLSNSARGAILGENSSVRMKDCVVIANENPGYSSSAGVSFFSSDVTVSSCVFENNTNSLGIVSRTGGGLYLYNCTSVVENCLLNGNTSESGAVVFENGMGRIQNCTIADNSSRAVYGIGNAQVTIRNTILWGNSGGVLESELPIDIAFCCSSSGEGAGSIVGDPAFIAGGYALEPVSPCIDRGTMELAPSTDLLGESRWDHPFRSNGVSQSDVDLGAVEFFDVDLDGDGIGDAWEIYWFGNILKTASSDDDHDGLFLLGEYQYGANPFVIDSDADGISDGDEVQLYQTNPANADSDADGLSDGDEVTIHGTDPANPDSDSDTMPDGWEIDHSFNPLSHDDATGDADGDGLNNASEYQHNSDPYDSDSDADGLTDGNEVHVYSSDPVDVDSDGDRLSDGDEVNITHTDPVNADSDSDHLDDGEEVNKYDTDPNASDTDSDGVDDGTEVDHNSNPLTDTDHGEPNTYMQLLVWVGDVSDSHSEKWGFYVRPEQRTTLSDPGDAVGSVINQEFGELRPRILFLEKGKDYYYDMIHQDSNQPVDDFDYTASLGEVFWNGASVVTGANHSGLCVIDDYDSLLGMYYVHDGDPDPTLKNGGTAPKTGKLTILSVDIVSVDATDDIGPTKINYRVNPSGVSIPSMTFTAPGITETRADVSGDFYFTYNQSDLPYGESQITLEYLSCEAVLTVNKEGVGAGQTEEIIIATIPADPGWVHWPISHRLSEGYARITYSGAPILPDSYTLHVGGSHVTLEADETVTIDWAHEKHRYHDDEGSYNEQAMTLYTGGPTLPPTTAYRKFYDSMDDRFFIPGKNLEGIAQMESVSLDGILPLNLANENIDQELE